MTDLVVEEGTNPAQSPLVAVTFQRDVHRKKKYLEAEPKALGITQIGLSVYNIICFGVLQAKGLSHLGTNIPIFISSVLVVIAGNVAVAAQNLHLPTLRACLGMQSVACGASIFNLVCTLLKMEEFYYFCWTGYHDTDDSKVCHQIENTSNHFYAGSIVVQVALLAISVTLAAYCCKVVNCCGPAPRMPVITIQHPESSREEVNPKETQE